MNRLWNAAPEVLVALCLFGGIVTVIAACSSRADRISHPTAVIRR